METMKYNLNLSNVRKKISIYKEQGKDVLYSAVFTTGKQREKLVDRAPVSQLSLITKNLKCENPDKIKVELYDGKDAVNTLWIKEFILSTPEPEVVQTSSFHGLGEVEISRIVDDRFRERQRSAEHEVLKERVMELAEENEELQDTIDRLEDESDQLARELEGKKNIRYYAGMLGDILESFGISKSTVKKPLAHLMGLGDTCEPAGVLDGGRDDNSGIVEETVACTPEQSKRAEIITLVADYLRTTDNQTLTNVFSIFSEIEMDNSISADILGFLQDKKQQS